MLQTYFLKSVDIVNQPLALEQSILNHLFRPVAITNVNQTNQHFKSINCDLLSLSFLLSTFLSTCPGRLMHELLFFASER